MTRRQQAMIAVGAPLAALGLWLPNGTPAVILVALGLSLVFWPILEEYNE